MKIQTETINKLLHALALTREDEIDCENCFEHMGEFVEMLNEGQAVEDILPKVKHHLDMCANCREEFEALHIAITEIGRL